MKQMNDKNHPALALIRVAVAIAALAIGSSEARAQILDLNALANLGANTGGNVNGVIVGVNGQPAIDLTDPNVTAALQGTVGVGTALNLDFCVELGILAAAPGACNGLVVPPDPDDPGDDVVDPNLILPPALLAVIGANTLPSIESQRTLSRFAMSVGTADLNARLARLRSGLKGDDGSDLSAPVIDDKNPCDAVCKNPICCPTEWEFFAQTNFGDLHQENFALGQDLDVNVYSAIVGAEKRINENLAVGFALSGVEVDGRIGMSLGRTDIEGVLGSAYATYNNQCGSYADLLYSYGFLNHEMNRRTLAGRRASSQFESNNQLLEVNLGHNFYTEKAVHGPYLATQYIHNDIDGYSETGGALLGVRADGQTSESLTTELGWQISFPMDMGCGTIAPHLRGAWVHQHIQDREVIGATLRAFPANRLLGLTQSPIEDFALVGGGFAYEIDCDTTLSADVEALFATDGDDYSEITAGLVYSKKF